MIAAIEPNSALRLAQAYRESDRALRVQRAWVGYILALVLMPAGVTLDFFVYPQLFWKILAARLVCDVALVPCMLLLRTPLGRRYAQISDKPCVLLPALSISWMIFASEGALSPYYAGLNLMVLAACLMMPYRMKEAALVCALVLITYAGACLLYVAVRPHAMQQASDHAPMLFNNLYFLALTSIICATACHYSTIRRYEDFRLRHELDENNTELETTVRKLKETEVQLVQSEKMNALGKLSAGLLHEVNNPLNFTFMALSVAEQEAGENASLQDTLKDIGQGMNRIRSVISDLRSFAYPSKLDNPEPFVLDEALSSALRLVAHEVGDITVDRGALNGARAIGVKSHVVHVFMNLIVNSVHAVKEKSLGRTPKIAISCEQRAGRLAVSVWDNGSGVRAEHLPRLCDPFFTTKEVGQGTGLGLSICHTIVKNHGGEIAIESQEGAWTKVTFDLPLDHGGRNN